MEVLTITDQKMMLVISNERKFFEGRHFVYLKVTMTLSASTFVIDKVRAEPTSALRLCDFFCRIGDSFFPCPLSRSFKAQLMHTVLSWHCVTPFDDQEQSAVASIKLPSTSQSFQNAMPQPWQSPHKAIQKKSNTTTQLVSPLPHQSN